MRYAVILLFSSLFCFSSNGETEQCKKARADLRKANSDLRKVNSDLKKISFKWNKTKADWGKAGLVWQEELKSYHLTYYSPFHKKAEKQKAFVDYQKAKAELSMAGRVYEKVKAEWQDATLSWSVTNSNYLKEAEKVKKLCKDLII